MAEGPAQASAIHDEVVGGGLIELGQVVAGDEDGGAALAGQLAQESTHLDDADRVEAVDRLVEDQQLGTGDEGDGDAQALTHAQGELPHPLAARVGQADEPEQLVLQRRRRDAADDAVQVEIVTGAHAQLQAGGLDEAAQAPQVVLGRAAAVARGVAEELDLAVGGRHQAADHAHEGGLARAVAADEAVDATALQAHVEILDGGPAPVALGERAGSQHRAGAGAGGRHARFQGRKPVRPVMRRRACGSTR